MEKEILDIYSNYLISSFKCAITTNMAQHQMDKLATIKKVVLTVAIAEEKS